MDPGPIAIGLEEFILRRIHKTHADPKQALPILPVGFRPTQEDVVGLSVYRQALISPAEVDRAGRKPGEYYVAALSVKTLSTLNLTVIPDEQEGSPPGHALIPELCFSAYQENKDRLKDVQIELARLASQAIVLLPKS
jgi:hypothetical protein